MRNWFVVLIAVLLIGTAIGISGSMLITGTTANRDINFVVTDKNGLNLNNIKYNLVCDDTNTKCTMELFKDGVFNGKTLSFEVKQECLVYNPQTCLEVGAPTCSKWNYVLDKCDEMKANACNKYSALTCKTMSSYTQNDFIARTLIAYKKELDEINAKRLLAGTPINQTGTTVVQ